jgi:hypothetical protein
MNLSRPIAVSLTALAAVLTRVASPSKPGYRIASDPEPK